MAKKKKDADLEALDRWQWDDDPDLLDDLVARIAKKKASPTTIATLLHVFERHPDLDGEELKVVVHALEAMRGYENPLIESMRRAPYCYAARMINRLLNAGKRKLGEIDLIAVLREAYGQPETLEEVREEIAGYLKHHGAAPPRKVKKTEKNGSPSAVTGDDLISLLRKKPDGPEVKAMAKRLGEKGRITGRDEAGAFLQFDKAVICFQFPKKKTLQCLFMPRERGLSSSLPLPMGLQLKMPRKKVRGLLGKPDREVAARKFMTLTFPAADCFDRPAFSLTVQYSPGDILIALQVSVRKG